MKRGNSACSCWDETETSLTFQIRDSSRGNFPLLVLFLEKSQLLYLASVLFQEFSQKLASKPWAGFALVFQRVSGETSGETTALRYYRTKPCIPTRHRQNRCFKIYMRTTIIAFPGSQISTPKRCDEHTGIYQFVRALLSLKCDFCFRRQSGFNPFTVMLFCPELNIKFAKTWTLFYNNVNTTIRKYLSRAFIWVVTPLDFVEHFRI